MDSNAEKIFDELENYKIKRHQKYSVDFKLKVINLVNLNVYIHSISDSLEIDRKTISIG